MGDYGLVPAEPFICVCGNRFNGFSGPCHEECIHCKKIAINPAMYNCCTKCLCGKIVSISEKCCAKCRCGTIYKPYTYIKQCKSCFGKECEQRANVFHETL
jgi:hypothetical protein